jgi:RadC-like JAB domain
MSGTTLYTTDANTPTGFRTATLDEIMAGARHALSIRIRKGTVFDSPKATADYLTARLAQREYETFTLIYLDNRHRLIACQDLFRGTIGGASVHPREVVKEALRHNAAAVILTHFVARHRMRVMCPWSFCARRSKGFVVERDFVGRRHITTGSSQGMPSPVELDGWLHDVPSTVTRSAGVGPEAVTWQAELAAAAVRASGMLDRRASQERIGNEAFGPSDSACQISLPIDLCGHAGHTCAFCIES